MNEEPRNKKLESIEAMIPIYQKAVEESSHPKTDKFNNFVNNFNRLRQEGDLLKMQGEIILAKKKYRKALRYAEAVVKMEERREFKKSWTHKTLHKIFLIQIFFVILLFFFPALASAFNLPDIVSSVILIVIGITLLISFFLLIYVFFRKP
jgi:Fe2+ transport system protein B